MKITKFGHCCLLVEENGLRIVTDPGSFTTQQNELKNIDLIVITHEHPDHFHVESVKKVLANNASAIIITNSSVGKLLEKEGIEFQVVEDGQQSEGEGITITGYGKEHAVIHSSIPVVQNTGYFIGERLFYPGDAFVAVDRPVEIVALSITAPWMKLSEALDYAVALKPKVCFPVHDGMLNHLVAGSIGALPPKILGPLGIDFKALKLNEATEL